MIFKEFSKKIREHFNEMAEGSKRLFEVEFDYEEMKNLYLNSYPEGSNEIYRKRREFDCSSCEKFIRDIGNVVAIKNGQLHTIWEPDIEDGVYSVVAKALDWYIRVAFNGEVYRFVHKEPLKNKEWVTIAKLELKNGRFNIIEMAETDNDPKDMWGLRTNQFVPVSVMCYSPNYWDEQQGIGHQHLFFMLKDCVNPEEPNGYYNEFLKPELEQHRRVFEALGAKAHVKDTDDQLSGVGFSLTRRNDLVVKVKGATERVLRVKF